jgi:hypothetical protein
MAMDPSIAADFVHHNCVSFFSDSGELSEALSLLSDSAVLEGTFRPEVRAAKVRWIGVDGRGMVGWA